MGGLNKFANVRRKNEASTAMKTTIKTAIRIYKQYQKYVRLLIRHNVRLPHLAELAFILVLIPCTVALAV